ncbi:MAG: asparagine synthase-related protein [Bacteroidota bacterium]
MLPKGLFGVVSSKVLDINAVNGLVKSRLSSEEDFWFKTSSNQKCLLGVIRSTLIPYPAMISCSVDSEAVGAVDGVFFSHSRLSESPHELLSGDFSLESETNGMFTVAAYDGLSLRLLSDRFASVPLYHRCYGGMFVFSSALAVLLNFPGMPSAGILRRGIAQFLCWHKVLKGDTVFEGVSKMQSAELLEFVPHSGQLSSVKYWSPKVEPDYSGYAVRDTTEAFRQAVDRAVTISPKPLCAALTGGLDSRTIWSVLKGRRDSVMAVTHAATQGYDFVIAKQIAQRLNLEHRVQWIGEEFLQYYPSHVKSLIEGSNSLVSVENAHLPYVYRKHLQYASTVIDGINTYIEKGFGFRRAAKSAKTREKLFQALWGQLFKPTLVSLMPDTESARSIEMARDALFHITPDPRDWSSPGCAADAFYITHVIGNHVTDAACVQNHFNRFITPYYDADYIDQVSKVPEELRSRSATQYETMKTHCPELLSISRSYSDVQTFVSSSFYVQMIPVVWHKIMIPNLRKLLPDKLIKTLDPYLPSLVYSKWFRGVLRSNVLSLTQTRLWFDEHKVGNFVREYLSGRNQDTNAMAMLMMIGDMSSLFHTVAGNQKACTSPSL